MWATHKPKYQKEACRYSRVRHRLTGFNSNCLGSLRGWCDRAEEGPKKGTRKGDTPTADTTGIGKAPHGNPLKGLSGEI
jgi:hypothetical protein